jgi:tetratricopeptide (TPR) repeat protein
MLATPAVSAVPSGRDAAASDHPRSYLVVPPENRSEDRTLYWLGEALSEAMERSLDWAGVEVATRDERRDLEREEMSIGTLSVTTLATRLKEAEELKVDRLVVGSFDSTAKSGEPPRVSVRIRVLDVGTPGQGTSHLIGPMPLTDLPEIQSAVAKALLDAESLSRPATPAPPPPARETSREAYEARVKSLLEEDPDKQAAYLTRALESDPSYLRARLELGLVFRDAERPEKALAALTAKPIQGDPVLAAQAEMIVGELYLEAGRPTPAIDAFRRSLRWRDESSTHVALARALIARGDLRVAAAELELAQRLDPEDPEIAEVRSALAAARSNGAPASPEDTDGER